MLALNGSSRKIVAGAVTLVAVTCGGRLTWGQVSGTSRPQEPIQLRKDPLLERSATENIVFGRIVDTDEHRLILRTDGQQTADVVDMEIPINPDVKVFVQDQPGSAADMRKGARVKIYRLMKPGTPATVRRVVVLNDETSPAATLIESTASAGLGLVLEATSTAPIVVAVRPRGPAEAAGIIAGDEVLSINGVAITTPDELIAAADKLAVGDAAQLRIRREGKIINVKALMAEGAAARDAVRVKQPVATNPMATAGPHPPIITTANLGAVLETADQGVKVVRLRPDSLLAKAGLRDGDEIQQVAGTTVLTPKALMAVLNELHGGAQVELVAAREGRALSFVLTVPQDVVRSQATETNTDGEPPIDALSHAQLVALVQQLQAQQARQQQAIDLLSARLQEARQKLGLDPPAVQP